MDWIYLTFANGYLYQEEDRVTDRKFKDAAEAEAWLEAEDIRATIR